MKEVWFRTNEKDQAVTSLQLACELFEKSKNEPRFWGWTIIAMHKAVQDFMVLALRGSNSLRVCKDNGIKERIWNYLDSLGEGVFSIESSKKERLRLHNFLDLYEMVKSEEWMGYYCHSKCLPADTFKDKKMYELNEYRNMLIHFIPRGTSIFIGDLLDEFKAAYEVIRFLCFESGNINLDTLEIESVVKEHLERIKSMIAAMKELLGHDRP